MTKLLSRRVALIAAALFVAAGMTAAIAQEGSRAASLPGAVEQHRPVLAANGMVVAQERRGAEIASPSPRSSGARRRLPSTL